MDVVAIRQVGRIITVAAPDVQFSDGAHVVAVLLLDGERPRPGDVVAAAL